MIIKITCITKTFIPNITKTYYPAAIECPFAIVDGVLQERSFS